MKNSLCFYENSINILDLKFWKISVSIFNSLSIDRIILFCSTFVLTFRVSNNLQNDQNINSKLYSSTHRKLKWLMLHNVVNSFQEIAQKPSWDHHKTQTFNTFCLKIRIKLRQSKRSFYWYTQVSNYLSIKSKW